MDSGNSSSMQSSSGPDDEGDSKPESSLSMTLPVPLFLDHHALSLSNYYDLNNTFLPSSSMFEPNYLPHAAYSSHPHLQQNPVPSTHLHLDTFRPNPNCNSQLPASSSLSPGQTMLIPQGLAHVQQYPSSMSSVATTNEHTKAAKNPRKRTAASQRAPTTVLNTDTSNFRAMVQEFTGFPATPFSGSRKLDLFGSGSIFRSRHHNHDLLDKMFPRHPSAKKLKQPSLMVDSGVHNSTAANCIIKNALTSTITSSIAQMATNACPDNSLISLPLNIPKLPTGNHQNPIAVPNSNILPASPSLMHDHNPIDSPISGLFHHLGGNSNSSAQDQLGTKWDGLQVRATDMVKTNNKDNDHSQPSNVEDYGGGTQRAKMNRCKRKNYSTAGSQPLTDYHSPNNNMGFENRVTVDNWFGPSD